MSLGDKKAFIKEHAMKIVLLCTLLMSSMTVAGASDLESEIEYVKNEYLNVVIPRRNSISDLSPSSQEEVARRIKIVTDTWDDFLAGQRDATNAIASGKYVIQGYSPLTEVEADYVQRLKNKHGIEYVPVDEPVTNINKWIYINSYNSQMEKAFERLHGRFILGYALQEAITNQGYSTYTCSSYFFVPYRFGFKHNNIKPLKE